MKRENAENKGEGGEEAGERGSQAKLSGDLDFALKIALIRGHILVGNELVQAGDWDDAHAHFLRPVEELYGAIRGKLKRYKTPPFSSALNSLAKLVKAKKGGKAYANAMKKVIRALDKADAGVRAKQKNWPRFTLETALESLKVAGSEYEAAFANGKLAKPVEYQDSRGFVWQAEIMIDSVSADLSKKNADALKQVKADFTELKKAWPSAEAPKTPVKDYARVLSDISRIELHASNLK